MRIGQRLQGFGIRGILVYDRLEILDGRIPASGLHLDATPQIARA